jgi:hypothetical protein
VAFFALLGAIFALTQYLQFVHGYSAIEAGAIMSPMALGLMMGAGSSAKAVQRLGVSRVVAAGLTGLAVALALTMIWDPNTGGFALAVWFFGLALAMGWVMAPATDAVVGAVPAEKTGVASAASTVARMISGALGVAVIGLLISSLYSQDVAGRSTLCPRRRRREPRTRSVPQAQSPLSSTRARRPSCSQRPAKRSRMRWASVSWSPRLSPPRWPRSWSAICRTRRIAPPSLRAKEPSRPCYRSPTPTERARVLHRGRCECGAPTRLRASAALLEPASVARGPRDESGIAPADGVSSLTGASFHTCPRRPNCGRA